MPGIRSLRNVRTIHLRHGSDHVRVRARFVHLLLDFGQRGARHHCDLQPVPARWLRVAPAGVPNSVPSGSFVSLRFVEASPHTLKELYGGKWLLQEVGAFLKLDATAGYVARVAAHVNHFQTWFTGAQLLGERRT
jgi:hypothetical protein